MLNLHLTIVAVATFTLTAVGAAGCADTDETLPSGPPIPATTVDDIVAQSEAGNAAATLGVPGVWRTKAFVEVPGAAAWVDLIWLMGDATGWHVVTVYADEALTIPLARWDVVRDYTLGGSTDEPAGAIELDWSDRGSWVVAYVEAPELLAAMGIDDCGLTAGALQDTSAGNCGAPLFPFRDCIMKDFAELTDDVLTFGDPQAVDRCAVRVTEREAWSFERVALDAELQAALEPYPPLQ